MLVSILLPILSKRVYAAPNDLTSQLQREARFYTVTNAIIDCLYDKNGAGLEEYVVTEDLVSSIPIFAPANANVGTHVKPSNGRADCGDENWVADAVDMLGFKTHTDFMNIFYDQPSTERNTWELKVKYGVDETGDAIQDFLKASEANGNSTIVCTPRSGCSRPVLSDAARYELLLMNFARGCGAKPVTDQEEINIIAPTQKITTKEVDATGAIKDTVYKLSQELKTPVVVGSGITANNDGTYSCETIGKQLAEYAPAFSEKIKQAVANNQPVGDLESALDQAKPKSKKQLCEESTSLLVGWIVCDGMELLSSCMDKILDQVDNMLNVDVVEKDVANGGDLKKSWSSFRAIASFMLLAIGLVMILSQALGGDK